jgi:Tol biopolymer transport system component
MPLPDSVFSVEGADHFDVSPDGSMILFDNARHTTDHTEPPRLGFHQLFVANIDGSGLRQLTDDPVGAAQGSWSPDGTKIVYLGGWAKLCCWGRPADLTVLDLETGTTTVLARGRAGDFYDPSFSRDGNSIVFTVWSDWSASNEEVELWTMPVGGGSPELLLEDRGDGLLSPDGTSIVYRRYGVLQQSGRGCASGFPMLWISDADGSDPRALSPEATNGFRATTFDQGVWSPDGTRVAYTEQLAPPEGCVWPDFRYGVYVMDVATGDETFVAFGRVVDWVDDRTVLVQFRVPQMNGG